jgi:hypothetical protein
MKKGFLFSLPLFIMFAWFAQGTTGNKTPDKKQPIVFDGTYIVYKGDTIKLGSKAFFIDGQLSIEEASKYL